MAKGSPADLAGVCVGDVLVECAGKVLGTAPKVIQCSGSCLYCYNYYYYKCKKLTTLFASCNDSSVQC